jgi:hypothetical protein
MQFAVNIHLKISIDFWNHRQWYCQMHAPNNLKYRWLMASVDIQVDIHCVLNEKNDDIYVNDLF